MSDNKLKEKTISSLIWSACQRFGTIFLAFVGNLILARFLTPEDFGLLGMLTIFISISEVFIDSGLGQALIQKDNPSEVDYSTVFWSNIFISIIFYAILFFAAPAIANFYGMEILKTILRIKGTVLLIQAFRLVQITKFRKELNFKLISCILFFSSLVSTIVSIVLAFFGFGVWSLVVKTLLESFLKTLIINIVSKWKPLFTFSFASFKSLFSFGGVMLVTSLVSKIYSSGQSLIIGKAFSAKTLGYYTQAAKLEEVPTTAIESVVNNVTFPMFSKIKGDAEKNQRALRKMLSHISYISFPMMIIFIICSEPIFDFLYSDVWLPSVPYFKYLCLVGMIFSINAVYSNLIKASGHRKSILDLQVTKRIIAMILLILSLRFGIKGLLITRVLIEYAFLLANARITKKLFGYNILKQIMTCLPNYLLSIFVGVIVYLLYNRLNVSNIIDIFINTITYIVLYISISWLLKFESFYSYKKIIFARMKKN